MLLNADRSGEKEAILLARDGDSPFLQNRADQARTAVDAPENGGPDFPRCFGPNWAVVFAQQHQPRILHVVHIWWLKSHRTSILRGVGSA